MLKPSLSVSGRVRFPWLIAALCVCQLLTTSQTARAQPVDPGRSASARALFDEGVREVDAGRWWEASEHFRGALALRESPVIRFNLASALVELSGLVEASELLHAVEADAHAAPELRAKAADKLADIGARIARLSVHVEGERAGLQVELDAKLLAPEQLDVLLTVDPGSHLLRAAVGGQTLDSRELTLADGATERVTLRLPAAAVLVELTASAAAVGADDVRPMDAGPARPPTRRKLWWGIAGGAAAITAAVVLGVLLAPRSRQHDSSSYQGDFDPPAVGVRVPQ